MTETRNPARLESLDVLRGLTIAGMILVNNPGDWKHTWPILKHAAWDGLTVADLVFPFFLVVVGVATALSVGTQLAKGQPKRTILSKSVLRTLKILALGLFLNLLWDAGWETFRIPGVLQRIALVYFCCVVAFLYIRPMVWMLYILASSVLALVLLKWFPASQPGSWYGVVDHLLFGNHVYQPTAPMDAEGFLSGLTAIQSGLFGLLAGVSILGLNKSSPWNLAITLLLAGIVFHHFGLPVNKLLWTPSFAMVTAGMALVLLLLFQLLEQNRIFEWVSEPFRRVGKNAVLVYASSEILEHFWVGHWFKEISPRNSFIEMISRISPFYYFNSLLWSLILVLFFLLIGWALYRKGWFLKL